MLAACIRGTTTLPRFVGLQTLHIYTIKVKPVVAQIAQNHVIAHFGHETMAKQFDFKNVWFISPPLLATLTWERFELAILEASDQMVSHLLLFKLFALNAVLIPRR